MTLKPGPRNLITDVEGITVGHAADEKARTGVTIILCADHFRAGVDVRGGGPGTRDTEVLSAHNLVGAAHAFVLSGGSVFGLAAADGLAAHLAQEGVGLRLTPDSKPLPITPAAVLHDLLNGGDKNWGGDPPYRALGVKAAKAADANFALGRAGAGAGSFAGIFPGGVGSASIDLGGGLIVGAIVANNAVGSPFMSDGKTPWAWPFEIGGEFGGLRPPPDIKIDDPISDYSKLKAMGRLQAGANTTIGVVAASADLSTAECKRVAVMAHDGLARAIRPAHTPFDGDTIFCVATGAASIGAGLERAAVLARIGSAAADCFARAIARGVYEAAK